MKNLKEWRQKVLSRDGYTCQKCGNLTSGLLGPKRAEAHHIKAAAQYPKLKLKVENGITLCLRCHRKQPRQIALFSFIQLGPYKYTGWWYSRRALKAASRSLITNSIE